MIDNRPGQQQWALMLPRFKELCDLEHSASEIADILNGEFGTSLTRNAVIGKRQRLGIGRKRVPVVNLMRQKAPPPSMASLIMHNGVPPFHVKRGVHIMDLTHGQCRWMDGPASSLLYCGQPTEGGVSWCSQHVKVVYGKSYVRS